MKNKNETAPSSVSAKKNQIEFVRVDQRLDKNMGVP